MKIINVNWNIEKLKYGKIESQKKFFRIEEYSSTKI